MKKRLIYLVILAFIASSFNYVSASEYKIIEKQSVKKGKKRWLMRVKANFRYNGEDYSGALRIYRKIYDKDSIDPKLNFLIGRCFVKQNEMDNALKYLLKAKALKPDYDKYIDYLMGEAYQYQGNIDSAIAVYSNYQSSLKHYKLRNDPVVELLAQLKTAKELIAHPVNVKINNMGSDINSEYDDGMPVITSDGKTLIFTSKRPDIKGSGIDVNTGDYYDNIFISTWDDEKKKWNSAEDAQNNLNTAGQDAILSISPDGNTIFVYRNIPKVTGSGDIYYSIKRIDGSWGNPKPLPKPINSSYFEGSCSLSPDGKTLYFVSERKGGYGNADIWKSKRIGKYEWAKPVNLGPVVNTDGDEIFVSMFSDGKTLFFASNGHKTMGGYDIFMTQKKSDTAWTKPVNLGYPINTTKNEISFILAADGKKAYITTNRDGGLGGDDIYEVDLSNYVFPMKIEGIETPIAIVDTNLSVLKGSVIESSAAQPMEAEIIVKDVASGRETKIVTNDAGDYSAMLEGNKEYEIIIDKKGYKKYSDKITLPFEKEKTNTLEKLIVLEKKK